MRPLSDCMDGDNIDVSNIRCTTVSFNENYSESNDMIEKLTIHSCKQYMTVVFRGTQYVTVDLEDLVAFECPCSLLAFTVPR